LAPHVRRFLRFLGLRRSEPARRSAYAGAASSRLLDWVFAGTQPADAEIRGDLRKLRARSRELTRNNAIASRYVDLVAENVIGPKGIQLQARIKTAREEFKDSANDRIEAAWREWGTRGTATADGRMSWHDLERLALRTWAADGEFILRLLPGFGNAFGFAVQPIDPDLLDVDLNRLPGGGLNEIRMGVELDQWERPLAYHFLPAHPSAPSGIAYASGHTVIPADQIVHLYQIDRPGQTRGVPRLAPVMGDIKQLAALQEAELVASRMAAVKSVFFEQDPEVSSLGSGVDQIPMEASPGEYTLLPPGVKATMIDPTHPNTAFADFARAIRHDIATGCRVSYASITGDLTAVNYSSIRAGMLQERDVWRALQRWTIEHLHTRVYRAWVGWAMASGQLQLATMDARRAYAVEFAPRGWAWVDPLKDMEAAILAVDGGLNSRTAIAAEQGRDFEEILAEIDKENQLAAEYGVELKSSLTGGGSNGGGNHGTPDPAEGGDDRTHRPIRLARGL
jgi:lambda family phage portal protein